MQITGSANGKECRNMSKQASEFQQKVMPVIYRGKEIFKPLNTGWIDEHVACVREYVANVFFYVKAKQPS